jgi:hypothetical protein
LNIDRALSGIRYLSLMFSTRKRHLPATLAVAILAVHAPAEAVEEAEYKVVKKDGDIELRDYEASIVAETLVKSDFKGASNKAFRTLFRYIDGENEASGKIAMTAPVSQEPGSQKIDMTAPVSQEAAEDGWSVSFMMPASFTMETIPKPTNPAVKIREIPAYRAAAIRYSGTWSEKNYNEHHDLLTGWLNEQGLQPAGPAVWARYNAPFTPWFMRRNEILIRIEGDY